MEWGPTGNSFCNNENDYRLNDEIIDQVKSQIRLNCSPRHVPDKVIETNGIPYTINGKKVEIAVKKIIHGEDVTNRDALENPDVLDYYQNIPELNS